MNVLRFGFFCCFIIVAFAQSCSFAGTWTAAFSGITASATYGGASSGSFVLTIQISGAFGCKATFSGSFKAVIGSTPGNYTLIPIGITCSDTCGNQICGASNATTPTTVLFSTSCLSYRDDSGDLWTLSADPVIVMDQLMNDTDPSKRKLLTNAASPKKSLVEN